MLSKSSTTELHPQPYFHFREEKMEAQSFPGTRRLHEGIRFAPWQKGAEVQQVNRDLPNCLSAGHLMLRGSGVVTLQVWQSEVLLTDGFHESHGGKCFVRVEEAALRT
ncbi:uncharacterized protein LOC144378022 isoform X4 [Ictidomys tridecemlineatus]